MVGRNDWLLQDTMAWESVGDRPPYYPLKNTPVNFPYLAEAANSVWKIPGKNWFV